MKENVFADGLDQKVKPAVIISLELIRGLASLGVFIHHVSLKLGGFTPLLIRGLGEWGHLMVVIFFVLSGYVIGLSQERKNYTAPAFLWSRVKRIEPLYLIGLALAVLLSYLTHTDERGKLIGNLFFLQSWNGSVVNYYSTNPVLWSLGAEMQFYLLFAVLIWFQKPWVKYLWWGLAYVALFLWMGKVHLSGGWGLMEETFSLSLIWLFGNLLVTCRSRFALTQTQALFLFSCIFLVSRTTWANLANYDPLFCMPVGLFSGILIHSFAQSELNKKNPVMKRYWPWVIIFYLITICLSIFTYNQAVFQTTFRTAFALLPWAVLMVSGWSGWIKMWQSSWFRQGALVLGRCSYALYILHYPIILLGLYLYPAGWGCLAWIVVTTIGCVGFFEYVVQTRAVRFMEYARGFFILSRLGKS